MNRTIKFVAMFVVLTIGCRGSQTQVGSTSTVAATNVTRAMVGHWSTDGDVALIITLDGESVVIAAPENIAWRMDISDATIVNDSIHFVQKNYLHNGEDHPFNGVACNSVARLVGDDKLEFGMTTVHTPEFESDILIRIK